MTFSEDVVRKAWDRAGAQCECNRRTHKHFYTPCGKQLSYDKRGRIGQGGWEANQVTLGAGEALSNCEILCWDCYDKSP
jgi:hypothetical protein